MKNKRIIFLLILVLIFPSSIFAAPMSSYSLGSFELGTMKLLYKEASISTYKAYGTHYVALADLRQMGLLVSYDAEGQCTNVSLPSSSPATTTSAAISLSNKTYTTYTQSVKVGNFETMALLCENRIFVPLASLNALGTLSITDNSCIFLPTGAVPVIASETTVQNLSLEAVQVTILDLYWKDEAILNTSTYMLSSGELLSRTPSVTDEDSIYVASMVQGITGDTINYVNTSYFGQLNAPLLTKYERYENGSFLEDYGDAIAIEKIIWAENTVNNKNLSSPTKYLVWTDINEQRTYIFEGSKNNWKLIKHFICSTGKDRTPTPTGQFSLTYKVPSFGQNKGYCCKYAFGFIGTTYLYHSIIFDKTGTYLLENKGVLGRKASDGCIRFSVEHAKWFYDTLIPGTTVYIS